jgi:hypothetical protein
MRPHLPFTILALVATPLLAQDTTHARHGDHENAVQGGGTLPQGWMARTDEGPITNVKMQEMAPGWHLTLGPAVILYRPGDHAEGPVHAITKIHLFPSSSHEEGYGLFFGGQNLQGPNQSYTYFLVRGDGKYLVKRRNGTSTTPVVDWTDNEAITRISAAGPVTNEISFQVGRDSVSFMVNGKTVTTLPASQVDTKGVVGIRANHNLNLHVESLGVHPLH